MIITHKHVVEDGWGWDLIASPDSQQRAGLLVLDVIVDNLGEQELVTYGGVGIAHTINERSEERRVGKECRSRWSQYH